MRVDQFKRLVAPVGVAVTAGLVLLVVAGSGLVQLQASTGGNPPPAFTDVPDAAPQLAGVVVWEPDGALPGRVVEPATRQALEAAWTRAWRARQRAAVGDPSLLEASFSGEALAQAQTLARSATAPVDIRLGEHHLAVIFYSDDGAVIGLHAGPVRVEEVVVTGGQRVARSTDETYDVVLLLEDGNWRVRQWVRTAATPAAPLSGS